MLASPLQLANATASLSQHGRRFRPHLLAKTINEQQAKKPYKPEEQYPIQLENNEYWRIVTDAMQDVIKRDEGTAYRFGRKAPYSVAAKTGTAQVFGGTQYEKRRLTRMPEALRDHSLFIAFSPVESPEIAVAVLVENDVVAASVAREVMDAYFNLGKENKMHQAPIWYPPSLDVLGMNMPRVITPNQVSL